MKNRQTTISAKSLDFIVEFLFHCIDWLLESRWAKMLPTTSIIYRLELKLTRNKFLQKFRGALVNREEEYQLNQRAGRILRQAGLVFEEWKDYNWIKKEADDEGYADYYLVNCFNETKMINEADSSVYRELVDIDSKLGTSISMQLSCCLWSTTRYDIIEV